MVLCPPLTSYSDKPGLPIPLMWCPTHSELSINIADWWSTPAYTEMSPPSSTQLDNNSFVANKIMNPFIANYPPTLLFLEDGFIFLCHKPQDNLRKDTNDLCKWFQRAFLWFVVECKLSLSAYVFIPNIIYLNKKICAAHLDLNSSMRALVIRFSLSTNWGEPNRTLPEKLLATNKTEARMVNWCNWDSSSCSRVLSISTVWGSREGQAVRRRVLVEVLNTKQQGNAPHSPTSGNSSFSGSQRRRFRKPWDSTIAGLRGSGLLAASFREVQDTLEESGVSGQVGGSVVRSATAWVSHLVVWSRRPVTGTECVSICSICIPETSRLWFFSKYTPNQ